MIDMKETRALLRRITAYQAGESCEATRIIKDANIVINSLVDGMPNDWPNGATVKLKWVGDGNSGYTIGWAKRDINNRLVSSYSGVPLDASCWEVIEERVPTPVVDLRPHMDIIKLAMGDERLTHEEFIAEISNDPSAFYGFRSHELEKLINLVIQQEKETMDSKLKQKIKDQIKFLDDEQYRVKKTINDSGFDCTTAPFVLAKQYRDALKKQIQVLRMNLEDFE